VNKKEAVWQSLMVDRTRANKIHGPGAWDVADVMGVLDQHNMFPERKGTGQHIDLRRERELANAYGWVTGFFALVFTVIALVRQSKPWGWAAAVVWLQGSIVGAYERALDVDLEEQAQQTPGSKSVRSAP
jgi:hypothetical protein